jgi:hypothetical protein
LSEPAATALSLSTSAGSGMVWQSSRARGSEVERRSLSVVVRPFVGSW